MPKYTDPQTGKTISSASQLSEHDLEEAFGRIIPEAGINKIPSLSSKIGGVPEAVGRGGMLVDDFANPEAWENSLKELITDNVLLDKLGKSAYTQAKKFDFNRQYQKLIDTINAIYSS